MAPGVSTNLVLGKTAMIHAIGLQPADYGAMAAAGTGLIWSPRSNITLYGETARVSVAARVGVEIALGTDWMPSGSMNMLRELACADSFNKTYLSGYFTDVELWEEAASGRDDLLSGLRQCGARSGQTRTVPERLLDHRPELGRLERFPPLGRDLARELETLIATARRRRHVHRRRLGRVTRRVGRDRSLEVRPERAARDQQRQGRDPQNVSHRTCLHGGRPHSYRSASIGLSIEARRAG